MRSDVSLHGTVGVEGDAGAPGTGVDGTEDAQAAEHDVQQITAAFAQLLEHMLVLASSAHVAAEFPVFVFSCWSSSVQEDDMEASAQNAQRAAAGRCSGCSRSSSRSTTPLR